MPPLRNQCSTSYVLPHPLPMKPLAIVALSLALPTFTIAEPFGGRIERFDSAFDALVAKDATIEKLADGVKWAEGPVWYEGTLVFSDPAANVSYRWRPGADKLEQFLNPSGGVPSSPDFREPGSNGMALDAAGRLLICQHGGRRVVRYERGEFTVIADRYEGKRLSSPNDLAVRRNGDVYFTDPPYGLAGVVKSPLREQTINGVYRVGRDGTVVRVIADLDFPNGIAFSPDESRLYVGATGAESRIMVYDVLPDGAVTHGRKFFDATSAPQLAGSRGGFDGLKVDRGGNLWTSGPGGILVVSPQGKLLGRFYTGVPTANCAFGGADGKTLFITANHFLLRVPTLTTGATNTRTDRAM